MSKPASGKVERAKVQAAQNAKLDVEAERAQTRLLESEELRARLKRGAAKLSRELAAGLGAAAPPPPPVNGTAPAPA